MAKPRNPNGYIKAPQGTLHPNHPRPYLNAPPPARPAKYNKVNRAGLFPERLQIPVKGGPLWCIVLGCPDADKINFPNGRWKDRKEKVKKHLLTYHEFDVLEDTHDGSFRKIGTHYMANCRSRGNGTYSIVGNPQIDTAAPLGLPAARYEAFHQAPIDMSNWPVQIAPAVQAQATQIELAPPGVNDFMFEENNLQLNMDMGMKVQAMEPFDQMVSGFENGIGFRQDDAPFDFYDFNGAAAQDALGLAIDPILLSVKKDGVLDHFGQPLRPDIMSEVEKLVRELDDAQWAAVGYGNAANAIADSAAPDFGVFDPSVEYADIPMTDEDLVNWVPPSPQELVFADAEFLG